MCDRLFHSCMQVLLSEAPQGLPGENVFVFEISGPNGEGTLTAECITVDAEHEDVVSGKLRLASGEGFNLFRMAGDY